MGGHHRTVSKLARAYRYINTFLDKVDTPVIENEVEFERRMRGHEFGEAGYDMQTGQGYRSAYPEPSRKRGTRAAGGCFGLFRRIDSGLCPLVKGAPGIGQRECARGPRQQPRTKPRFQLRNGFGDSRLPLAQDACGSGKGACLYDQYKLHHGAKAIHIFSFGMNVIALCAVPQLSGIYHHIVIRQRHPVAAMMKDEDQ
jgi:hypothetical protein